MSNRFGIPNKVEQEIRARDKVCVYCGKAFDEKGKYGDRPSIEHLDRDPPFYWAKGLKKSGIAICCGSCNSSRGKKKLLDWFRTEYCLDRNINKNTVAEPVKEYLNQLPIITKSGT